MLKTYAYSGLLSNPHACVLMRAHILSSVQLFVTSWIIAHQTPLSMELCRQEYWSGLPFPLPGGLPDPGM